MTHELIHFLRTRYDEEEQAALTAATLCGCHPPAPAWSFRDGDGPTDGRILVVDDPHPGQKRKIGRRWNGSFEGLYMAEHIVRHDPSHVLREIEAKRQLLDEHQDVNDGSCGTCVDGQWGYPTHGGSSPQRFPCRTLRLLALPYAHRPGYREEWRP
ncbi:DUF6221 family protein [Streptomyces chartreusis]|uniref:DUF6221 family protein n=1 Tax=Streptomyces chartreusis TaxID=1969 RepID=UPI0033D748EE